MSGGAERGAGQQRTREEARAKMDRDAVWLERGSKWRSLLDEECSGGGGRKDKLLGSGSGLCVRCSTFLRQNIF